MLQLFREKSADDLPYSRATADLTARQQLEIANTVIRELDRLFDRVTDLPLYRREAVRCLIGAAGTLLQVELSENVDEYRQVDSTSRELIGIALKELGLELKDE